MNIIAGFKDLQITILKLNEFIIDQSSLQPEHINLQLKFIEQIIHCIKFHNFMLKYIVF